MAEKKAAFAAETKLEEETAVITMHGEINQDADAALTTAYADAAQMQPTTIARPSTCPSTWPKGCLRKDEERMKDELKSAAKEQEGQAEKKKAWL